jgi:hypothetical protein
MLENAMYAAHARPLIRGLIGQGVGIMRFAYIEQIKIGLFFGKFQLLHHSPHIVVFFHQFVSIEPGIQNRFRIQHGKGDHGVGTIT